MRTVNAEGDYSPDGATCWATFLDEPGGAGVRLYENDKGEFFAVNEHASTKRTGGGESSVIAIHAEVFTTEQDLREWLAQRLSHIMAFYGKK
jgi:hypothetical protein